MVTPESPSDWVANDDVRSDSAVPALLFFYSPTSGPCRRVEGFLSQVLQRRANHSTFLLDRIDVEERPDVAERFQVTDVPTLVVVSNGRECARLTKPTGARPLSELLAPWLK